MATLTETRHAAGFLVSEEEMFRSRERVIVTGSAAIKAGTPVGRVLASAATVLAGSNTGNGTFTMDSTTPLLAGVQEGAYKVAVIEPGSNAGVYEVEAPDGRVLGTAAVGATWSNQIKFVLADGATDFVSGDFWFVYVRAGSIAAGGSNTGNGVATLYQTSDGVQVGAYALACTAAATNAGTFSVTAPDGTALAALTVGTRYTKAGLDLLVADGSTDFVVGDTFTVTVVRGKVKAWDPANTDGSDVVYGVAWEDYDATSADVKGNAIVRDAQVQFAELQWKVGLDASQKESAKAGLIARRILPR